MAGILALTFLVSKTSCRVYLRNVFLLSWLLLFTFIANLWGNSPAGQNMTLEHGVVLTSASLFSGILAVGKLSIVAGWVTILATTASPLELINGLEKLLHPLKIAGLSVSKFSIIAMLSLRFIPILFEEGHYLIHAYIARGIDLSQGNLLVRLKNYMLLCGPLFSSMLRRVDHLALAMESRAFRAGAERTSLHELRMKSADYVILCTSLLLFILIQQTG
jgi:energy-coupling factor transport system permease protein